LELSVNERLGFAPSDKLLIIHVDDIGVCHSANRASFEALTKGAATSGSLMMPCPWAPEAVELAKQHPGVDLGVHATFTSERTLYRWGPLTSAPSFLDREGCFHRTSQEAAASGKPEEFEQELRAQIERALALGLRPTHIDSHMFTCITRPDFFEIYIRLGREYGLPPLIFRPESPGAADWLRASAPGYVAPDSRQLEKEGFILMDGCVNMTVGPVGEHLTSAERFAAYHQAIRRCVRGLNCLFVHMAFDDEETRAAMGEKPARSRFYDYQAVTDDKARKAIEQAGVKLINFGYVQRIFTR